MTKVGVFVPVSAVFPEMTDEFTGFCSLVRSLSRTDALFWCARLNSLIANPNVKHRDAQQHAMSTFFSSDQIERVNRFAAEHGGADDVTVFSRGQLLELMRWICLLSEDRPNDGVTFEDPQARLNFVKALLIASDLWARRVYRDRLVITGDRKADRQRAIASVRQAIAVNMPTIDLSAIFARGPAIYGEAFRRAYPSAEAEFEQSSGLTLKQYFACVAAIVIHYTGAMGKSPHTNPAIFSPENIGVNIAPGMVPIIRRYLSLDSQTAEELRVALWKNRTDATGLTGAEDYNYRPFRDRPILRAADGRSIVLDPVFYSEKSSVGPLFAIVNALGKRKRANTVFGAFGDGFEAYALDLLKAMYPSRHPLLDRLSCNPQGVDAKGNQIELTDACLNDVTTVVIFEAKALFMPEDAVLDTIDGQYLDELRKRYAAMGRTDGERDKGVGQLARSIRRIALGEIRPLHLDLSQAQVIYPVLVAFDVALNGPGHAEFMADELVRGIEPDETRHNGYVRKGRFLIAPLTLMTIDDLETLESSVRNFRLIDMLQDYANAASSGLRVSLHDFMLAARAKYKLSQSTELADRSMKMLNDVGKMLFPTVNWADASSLTE